MLAPDDYICSKLNNSRRLNGHFIEVFNKDNITYSTGTSYQALYIGYWNRSIQRINTWN